MEEVCTEGPLGCRAFAQSWEKALLRLMGKKKMSVNHHALCCWYFPFADRLILFESLFDSLRQRQLILDPK